MDGNAPTTMLVFSRRRLGAAAADPLEHPEASVTIAAADARVALQDFISLQTAWATSHATPRVWDDTPSKHHATPYRRPPPVTGEPQRGGVKDLPLAAVGLTVGGEE